MRTAPWPLLPAWVAGVCASFALPQPWLWWWVAASVAAALAALCLRRRYSQIFQAARLVCAVCLGMAFGVWRTEAALEQQWTAQLPVQAHWLTLTVVQTPQQNEKNVRFLAEAHIDDSIQPATSYRFLVTDYHNRDWPVGSRWRLFARIKPMIGEANPAGYNREAWALANHIHGTLSAGAVRTPLPPQARWRTYWQTWRGQMAARWQAQAAAYPAGVGLLQALSVGEQSALSNQDWQALRALGLNHLVSISGLHVGMLALLAAALMRVLLRFWPKPPRRPATWVRAAAVAAAAVYSALAGFSVPTQRALLMTAVFAWGLWRQKRWSVWQVWWAAAALVLLFDPLSVLSAGFWLSFLIVAALFLSGTGVLREARWRQFLRVQAAAALASGVLTACFFGSVSVWSPVVNLFAIPWFTLVLVPLALLCLLVPWPPLLQAAAFLSQHTLDTLHLLAGHAPLYAVSSLPWGVWCVLLPAVALLLYGRTPLTAAAWLAIVFALTYAPPRPQAGTAEITVWDVGQGLSVGIATHSHNLLFDTGTAYAAQSQLLPNLRASGVRRLDALVLSHSDHDHDGGADMVREAVQPQTVWSGQPETYPYAARYCRGGGHWTWDGVWFEWLTQPAAEKGNNARSCVLRVVAAGQAVLITGDLGQRGEQQLVARYGGDLYSQILILGHHGSYTSSSAQFVRAVSPDWGVASAGFANHYGHPHPSVRELLEHNGIMLLRTDTGGALRTVLSEKPIAWRHLAAEHRPYWQRKPGVSTHSP